MPTIFQENFSTFTAAGFAPTPGAGQLDSDAWIVTGFSEGASPAFGFTGASGDFARGVINGDPTTAGVYATAAATPGFGGALLYQPTGGEGDNDGSIIARIANTTGAALTNFTVGFDWIYRNTGDRASTLVFEYSTDGTNWTVVADGGFVTPTTQSGQTVLGDSNSLVLTGVTVADAGFLYLRWRHDLSTGSGSRDEFGIDNVVVDATSPAGSTVSVNDVSLTEGDAGTSLLSFTVTRSGSTEAFSVDYATANGTASAGSDYEAMSGTLNFAEGETSKVVSVVVYGDTALEPSETVLLNLSGATNGVTLSDAQGVGSITNDDLGPPSISVSDVTLAEGNAGTTNMIFTVTRTGGLEAFSVDYSTADNTANAADYAAASGTLNFAAGETSKTITVAVSGDLVVEPTETLFVNLSNATNNAVIADGQGQGTITNDDAAGPSVAPWINEFHYDNAGGDTGEFIEIAGPAGLDLSGYTLVLYNGNGGGAYNTKALSGVITNQANGFGVISFAYPADGIQNGAPDGIALVGPGGVLEFISYEGVMTATAGPAMGMTSVDVAVAEGGSATGTSIAKTGPGFDGSDFDWVLTGDDTPGVVNAGQTFDQPTPRVRVSDTSVTEGAAGTTVLTFTVSRSGTSDAFEVSYASADGTATIAGGDYAPVSGVLSFAAGETSKVVQVTVNGDLASEPNETLFLNLSNATNGAVIVDAQGVGTIVTDDIPTLKIYEIQGAGHTSPVVGQVVITSGIVTAIDTTGSRGFWIQEATGDGNTATSDAVFVFTGVDPGVTVGQTIQVQGTVTEYDGGVTTNLPVTEIVTNLAGLTVLNGGALSTLPAAVVLGAGGRPAPTTIIDNDGNTTFDPATDGLDFYETLEGMRVTVPNATAVSATDGSSTWVVADDGAGATGLNGRGGVTVSANDFNPERVQIYYDDGVAPLSVKPEATMGDNLGDITGVMHYFGGNYELLPTQIGSTGSGVALAREVTTLDGDANHITIAGFNVENLDPFDDPAKIQGLAQNIVTNLGSPDIIGVTEMQDVDGNDADNNPANNNDYSGAASAAKLIAAIVAAGGPQYVYVEVAPTANNVNGGEANGNIRNGFLYNPERVGYVAGSAELITDNNPANGDAYGNSRKPLAADFTFNGETVTVVAVHNTSRLGSEPLFGDHQPAINEGDQRRIDQTAPIKAYVDAMLAVDPAAKVVVLGDFNAFQFETSLTQMEVGGTLTNLSWLLPAEERYSYVFEGNAQQIDHILATSDLMAGAQFDIVHLNSGQRAVDQTTDHDGVVSRLYVNAKINAVTDKAAVNEGATVTVDVLANDTDSNAGDTKTLLSVTSSTAAGRASVVNGKVVYVADGDAADALKSPGSLVDTLTYQVQDSRGAVSTGTIDVTVRGIADAPVRNGSANADTMNGTPLDDRINGLAGADKLTGAVGTDTLDGGAGNDTLSGGVGVDRFVFSGAFGKDVVTDFEAKDFIQLGASQFVDFAGVLAKSAQVGADVVITLDASNSITLQGVTLGSLQSDDFLFV
jgi:predicted extracellular nuclease